MAGTLIVSLGLNHRTAPVSLREQINISIADLAAHHHQFAGICSFAFLSTCNRQELYATVSSHAPNPRGLLLAFLAESAGISPTSLDAHYDYYSSDQAVSHLFGVAAGLDSLVLGEPQILGQVNDAFLAAQAANTLDPQLSTLFQAAIRAGKRARNETTISSNPASISSVAINLAHELCGNLQQKQVLVIGLGEMGQLALKALGHRRIYKLTVANRTLARAQTVARAYGITAYSLADLPQAVATADVVISATGAPTPIISAGIIALIMAQRPGKPMVIIDLAVPRDVDPAVKEIAGIHYFDIDSLRGSLDAGLTARQNEVPAVKAIIQQEVAILHTEWKELTIKPLITNLRQKAEEIRQQELERTLRYLGEVDPVLMNQLQHFSRALVNKLLHDPTNQLRIQAQNSSSLDYADTVRDLFGLS